MSELVSCRARRRTSKSRPPLSILTMSRPRVVILCSLAFIVVASPKGLLKMNSWVWNHFSIWEEDECKADCSICGAKISRGKDRLHLTTSSLSRHLATAHSIKEPRKRRNESEVPSAATAPHSISSQPTIKDAFSKLRQFDARHPKAIKITNLIGEMIGRDLQPYSIVENDGFGRLLHELEPRYSIPSRSNFSQTVAPRLYERLRSTIKAKIEKVSGIICATTDIWTSVQTRSYMSITANFIGLEEGSLARFTPVLSCRELTGVHDAEHILSEIRAQEVKWGVKFFIVLSDNGSNITKALSDGEIMNVRCMAHTINLCVRPALKAQHTVKHMLTLAKSIVSHYHRSSKDSELLMATQERLQLPKHRMILDVETRWNSTYYMLERLVEQREAVNDMSYHGRCETLNPNQWRIAASLTRVLKKFDLATKEVSAESATISCVLPLQRNLLACISQFEGDSSIYGLGSLLDELKEQLRRRFVRPETGQNQPRDSYFQEKKIYDTCVSASILDPRVKLSWASEISRSQGIQYVMNCLEQRSHETPSAVAEEELETSSSDDAGKSMVFQAGSVDTPSTSTQAQDDVEATKLMLGKYLSEPPIKRKKCPLQFWMKCAVDFPQLYKLAIDLLSCPPTSVDSERLFSSAGNVATDLRNRLTPENVEILTFLHVNLRKFKLPDEEQ